MITSSYKTTSPSSEPPPPDSGTYHPAYVTFSVSTYLLRQTMSFMQVGAESL